MTNIERIVARIKQHQQPWNWVSTYLLRDEKNCLYTPLIMSGQVTPDEAKAIDAHFKNRIECRNIKGEEEPDLVYVRLYLDEGSAI